MPWSAQGSLKGPKGDDAPVKRVDSQFAKPMFIAHRGAHLIHGEHSLEAYRYAADAGFPIEPDIQILADGGLACIHDATTTRTMRQVAGSAKTSVSAITSTEWMRNYRVAPEVAGAPYEQPVLFEQVLDEFGGRTLIVPEMKDVATRTAVCAAIIERGLQKAVLCQSFNQADVTYSASLGITSMFLTDVVSPATIKAAGIDYVGVSINATQTYINSCNAAGLKVIVWTVNTRTQVDTYLANGVHGFFSDDPAWASYRTPRSLSDPFKEGIPYPHMVVTGDKSDLVIAQGGIGQVRLNGTDLFVAQDWCLPITSGQCEIYFTVEFLPDASTQQRWVSVALGLIPSEAAYVDAVTTGQNVIHALVRREGSLNIYTNVGNATTTLRASLAAPATPIAAAGRSGVARMRLVRTASAVTLTNLDTGGFCTWNDTAHVYVNARFSLGFSNTDAIIRDVRVRQLPASSSI